MVNALAKFLGPLRRAVSLMIGRGIVKLVNDAGGFQELQIALLAGEVSDKIPRVQNYGMSSNPQPGAQAVIVCLGGNRNKAIAVAVDDPRYRMLNLQSGEVVIYDDLGQKVYLKRTGIVIEAAGTVEIKGLAGAAVKGLVQGDCLCAYTGQPHPMVSATVKGSL